MPEPRLAWLRSAALLICLGALSACASAFVLSIFALSDATLESDALSWALTGAGALSAIGLVAACRFQARGLALASVATLTYVALSEGFLL